MPRSGVRMRLGKGVPVLTVLMALSCGGGEDPQAEPGDRSGSVGRLVIIGGGLQAENIDVYQAILDGRSGDGPMCVFPTASAQPQASMEAAVMRIDAVGGAGSAQGIFLTVDNPEDAGVPGTVETIRSCSGFYFSGGVQTRIVQVFRPNGADSPAFQALAERFEAGAVVSGSSAGAAIMSNPRKGLGFPREDPDRPTLSGPRTLGENARRRSGDRGLLLRRGNRRKHRFGRGGGFGSGGGSGRGGVSGYPRCRCGAEREGSSRDHPEPSRSRRPSRLQGRKDPVQPGQAGGGPDGCGV